MRPDIKVWNPENPAQWNKTLAWTTVWLSTFSLTFGFCAWFLVPSLAPRLNEIGFSLTHSQLYSGRTHQKLSNRPRYRSPFIGELTRGTF